MTQLMDAFDNFTNATKTCVIGVFSSGIFFMLAFILVDQLVEVCGLLDKKKLTYRKTIWRSAFQLSKASKVINEDAASRCPLRRGLLYCVFR
jgi:hypothetical protein